MSGRIRSIKPEWLTDERILLASSEARVLSIALLLLADDAGRGVAHPTLLGAKVFPQNSALLQPAFTELRPWFVRLYQARGQTFYEVVNWRKHQKIDRPSPPKTPEPKEGQYLEGDSETLRDPIVESSRSFVESSERVRASRDPLPSPPDPDPDPDPSRASPRPDPLGVSLAGGTDDDRWVFDRWAETFGKTGATFDARRAACLTERRIAGMTRDDAVDALAGAKADPYVTGEKNGEKHERLSFIFGDQERFEEFRDAGRAARSKPVAPAGTRRPTPRVETERKPVVSGQVPKSVLDALAPKRAGVADG